MDPRPALLQVAEALASGATKRFLVSVGGWSSALETALETVVNDTVDGQHIQTQPHKL